MSSHHSPEENEGKALDNGSETPDRSNGNDQSIPPVSDRENAESEKKYIPCTVEPLKPEEQSQKPEEKKTDFAPPMVTMVLGVLMVVFFACYAAPNLLAPSWMRLARSVQLDENATGEKLAQAQTTLNQALKEADEHKAPDKDKVEILYRLGIVELRAKKFPEAIAAFERILKLSNGEDPKQGIICALLCEAYLANKQALPAIEAGERAVDYEKRLKTLSLLERNANERIKGVYANLLKNLSDAHEMNGDYHHAEMYIRLYITYEALQSTESYELAKSYEQLTRILAGAKRVNDVLKMGKKTINMILETQDADYKKHDLKVFGKWLTEYLKQNGHADEADEVAKLCELG